MVTTPTFWSDVVTFSDDIFAFGPRVAPLADNTFAIVWEDGSDIFGRHLNAFGSFTGGNFLSVLSGASAKSLFAPQVAQQTDGRVVVEYNLQFGSADADVLWHSPNADFAPHGSAFPAINSGFSEILNDTTATAGGGTAVAYSFPDPGPGPENLIFLRFLTGLGLEASNNVVVGNHAGETQQNAAVTGIFNGNVAVAYENFKTSNGARDVRMHVYTPTETDVAGEILVSGAGRNAGFPDVAVTNGGTFDIDNDGQIVIAWQDNTGIAFRRFSDEIAAPIDPAPQTIAGSAGGLLPKITALNDGGFIVGWVQGFGTESDGSSDLDIVLQRFDIDGDAVGDKVLIDNPGDQGFHSLEGLNLTTLADGRVAVVFESETGDATNLLRLDYVILDPREPTINGTSGNEAILGRLEASKIFGLAGNDKLVGMADDDKLKGGDGNDILVGGLGRDKLFGGPGADTFDFDLKKESRKKAPDVIKDFDRSDDLIDLLGIDAKKGGADNEFTFIGRKDFHDEKGELHYVKHKGRATIEGDINGDGRPDFRIEVLHTNKLTDHDFVL